MNFLRWLRPIQAGRISTLFLSSICCTQLWLPPLKTEAATLPAGFSETRIASGISSPTAMEFAPDGRLFYCEQSGRLRVIKNGALLSTPFVTLTVDTYQERGLIGVAFDPNFSVNKYVYVQYTVKTSPAYNRISRFTANGDVAVSGSETVLFQLSTQGSSGIHNAGALHFRNDGKLYFAAGDNSTGSNSQLMSNTHGKLLRINPDGTIPTDNPFYSSASGNNRAIYSLGLRNPFTFAIQPGTGRIFVNDVGLDTWEEINDAMPGANFGWPNAEGSSSNTAYKNPLYQYAHTSATVTGCAITGGSFYNPSTVQFPSEYVGDYFFADYCSGWIKRLDFVNGNVVYNFASGLKSPVDIKIASDGSLYYLMRGDSSTASAIYRVQYSSSQAPAITQQPASQTVSLGQSATFFVSASGSDPLSYQWLKNGVVITGATSPTHTTPATTSTDNGAKYSCRVGNSFGTVTSSEATLTVTSNTAPTASISSPANGVTYKGGDVITYEGAGSDTQDGTLPSSAFTWRVDFHHENHTHPFMAEATGSRTGSFTIPVDGETSDNVFFRIHLTVKDSGGLTSSTYRDIAPQKSTITLASSPSGLQIRMDGQSHTTPASILSVVNVRRNLEAVTPQAFNGKEYEFSSWSDGSAATHIISTPPTNTTYTATFREKTASNGLNAVYFNNMDFTGTSISRIDPNINFNWGFGSPSTSIASDTFSARWTGQILAKYNETHTFTTRSSDGVRLWVNNQLLIDRWQIQSSTEYSGTIVLKANTRYDIKLEYFEYQNSAIAQLYWSSPSMPREIIPQTQLFTSAVNPAPGVQITSPSSGTTFTAPANVSIQAAATDANGSVSKVEFFAGSSLLSSDTSSPYSAAWNSVSAGTYALSARATDNGNASTTSSPVNITVRSSSTTSANAAPTATLTSPSSGATYAAPAAVPLAASAADSDGSISKVEFFTGTLLIATDSISPYAATWSSVAAGSHSLTAKATDNANASGTSSAVSITVTSSSSTGSNPGSLSGVKGSQPAALNLSTQGTLDWGHWGLGSPADWNHKAGITAQISNVTKIGTMLQSRYTDGTMANSWSGGTPISATNNTTAGIYTAGVGNGFQFTVPADQTLRTLRVYCGVWKSQGRLEASLSDASAPVLVDTSHGSTTGSANTMFTLQYKAGSAGQTLNVKWTVQTNHDAAGGGTVGFQAVTLQ